MATVGEVRARSRGEIRTLVLDAARTSAVEHGWRAVRMGELATEVGVSRQALHQEFGAKAQLGSELLHREIDELLTGFATALAVHSDDVATAIREAATFALNAIIGNPLLQTVISGRGDETLLALLTTQSDWLIRQMAEVLRDWAVAEFPTISAARVEAMAEPISRLALSASVAPTAPTEGAARSLARVACLLLDVQDDGASTEQD